MKFCQKHWDRLRDVIKAKGMAHLIAKNGQTAAKNIVKELEGKLGADDYDPLMACHWLIMERALECGGLYLLNDDYCPLCEAIKHTPVDDDTDIADEWIDGCTDAVKEHCIKIGALPKT